MVSKATKSKLLAQIDTLDKELKRETDEHNRVVKSIEDEIIAVQSLIMRRKLSRKQAK